jgi:hypothetical protein
VILIGTMERFANQRLATEKPKKDLIAETGAVAPQVPWRKGHARQADKAGWLLFQAQDR